MTVSIKPPCPPLRERFKKLIVFDVESIGLYGDPFAIGWAIFKGGELRETGGVALRSIVDSKRYGADSEGARGALGGWRWIAENPTPESNLSLVASKAELLAALGRLLKGHKARGFEIAADFPSPVEANAIIECARLGLLSFEDSPYPLWDIAGFMACAGMDPKATYPRRPDESPPHCPVADAIQSGRLLFEAIDLLEPDNA